MNRSHPKATAIEAYTLVGSGCCLRKRRSFMFKQNNHTTFPVLLHVDLFLFLCRPLNHKKPLFLATDAVGAGGDSHGMPAQTAPGKSVLPPKNCFCTLSDEKPSPSIACYRSPRYLARADATVWYAEKIPIKRPTTNPRAAPVDEVK